MSKVSKAQKAEFQMAQLEPSNTSSNQTMSSREIAELTGKQHRNVLRDIEVLNESYEKLAMLKVEQGVYYHPNTGKQQHREYLLTKIQTLDLMTGYNTELRVKVNRRWEELENNLRAEKQFEIPQTFTEALRLALQQAEKIEEQALQIEEQKPKVLFAEAVETSETTILVGELAKILKQNGVDMGQNRLFEWLRNNGYLIGRKGTDYNMPTQRSMDLGLFEIREYVSVYANGLNRVSKTSKVTGKGQVYFVDKFLNK